MIDPLVISTIRVGELPNAPFNLTDKIPHEVGVDLKSGTIEELSTFISAYIGATDAVGFRAISVTDGQTLPTTTKEEFILVGKGTFYNVAGGSTIICTEELNAIVSNGSFWFIGVEIPVNIELSGVSQFIRQGFLDTTPSEDAVYDALELKVPYTGAASNVNLGEFQLTAGQIAFDQTPTQTAGVGVMRWNDTDGTLDLGLKGGNVTLQLGQEQIVRVVNKTGANLTEDSYHAVYTSGAQGQRLKVDLALANSDLTSNGTLGLVTENILVNQEGFITTNGLVRGVNTTGSLQSETWADGDVLYLSPTVAGRITNIKPIAPQHSVTVGICVYAHATQGSIFVKVDNGYELDELHNVLISSEYNNQALIYESATGLWKNKSIQSALGYAPLNSTNNDIASNPPTSFVTTSYDAFPLMLQTQSNKIKLFYRVGAAHVDNTGVIVMKTSLDGGATYTSASTIISQAGVDCRNVSGGVTSTGRIILYFMKYNATTSLSISQGYVYSDDEGATWSAYTTIETNSHTFYSPYGGLVNIGDGKIMQGWYGETNTSTYSTYVKISSDNGATWGTSILVATSPTTRYGEASYSYLDGGTIIGIVRNSAASLLQQVISTDNGATWAVIGAISFDTGAHVSPTLYTFSDANNEKYVACFYANRTDNKLKVIVGSYTGLIAGVSGWDANTRTDLTTHTSTDFGYPTVAKSLNNNKFLIALYKASSASVSNINFLNFVPLYNSITSVSTIKTSNLFRNNRGIGTHLLIDNASNINRWAWQTINAESTGNAGSDLNLLYFNDAGSTLGSYMTFTRSSAQSSFAGQVRSISSSVVGFYQARKSDTIGNGVLGGNSFALRNGNTTEDLNFDVFNRVSSTWINPLTINNTGTVVANFPIRLKGYTVATLPTGTLGDMAYVTDATAPTYNGTLTGGGAVKIPVFYDGTAWKAH